MPCSVASGRSSPSMKRPSRSMNARAASEPSNGGCGSRGSVADASLAVSSVHAPIAAAPVVFAHVLARELAVAVLGQLRHEIDRARPLEVGEPAAAELHDLAIAGGGAFAQHHDRLDGLAPMVIGHAHHADLVH